VTLLETLVALVVLGLTAVGFLELFQGTARSTRNASEWVQAVSYAEAAMEQTKLGLPDSRPPLADSVATGFSRTVEASPWLAAPGLMRISVTVTLPGGGAFTLQRLVRAP
jgi:type II secretory pathway pseudopilin PulG